MGDKKQSIVSRKLVVFEERDNGYYIYLIVQGFKSVENSVLCNHLPIGYCKKEELERQIEIVSECNYNIEVKVK